jgi:endoglucanase
MKNLLEKLCNAPGISGHEEKIREIIIKEVESYVDTIETDTMGNLIVTKFGYNSKLPTVMLAAHMDEVGLSVRYIDVDGYIFFSTVGGLYDQTLLNQKMVIHTDKGKYYGVIGSKPPHVMKREDYDKVIKIDSMFLDVGAVSKTDAENMGIEIGNQITFDSQFTVLHDNIVSGKAFDNRAGCVMLIETLKRMKNVDVTVHAVFTVQEEVGLKGAKTSAYKLNPNFAFATDVTIAGDHPGITIKEAPIKMGLGPVIIVSDGGGRGIIVPKIILNRIKNTSNEYSIPIQLEVSDGGTTDGTAIHLTRDGIPTGVISIPCRYIHTPHSLINIKDLENSVNLLTKMLENW